MADSTQEPHRPGPWKQKNKVHKHGKHKSKGSVMNSDKGRVSLKLHKVKVNKEMMKRDRRNQMKQIRTNKRNEVIALKRSTGIDGSPPHLVVCVPLSSSIAKWEVSRLLTAACGYTRETKVPSTSTHLFPIAKQRFTFLHPTSDNLYDVLDCTKVADTILFVYKADEHVSSFGELVLDTCSAQGMPSTCHVVMGLSEMPKKRHSDVKKTLQNFIDRKSSKEKLRCLDNEQDACNILRFIGDQKRRPVQFRDLHPHIVADNIQFVDDQGHGILKVSGYVRGRSLSVNGLVLIPNIGEFQLSQIDSQRDPCPVKGHSKNSGDDDMMIAVSDSEVKDEDIKEVKDEDIKILEVADPSKQESLVSEVIPDPMEGEQTWPTQEELEEADQVNKSRVIKSVPKGTSNYQAAWIMDSDGEEYKQMISDDEGEGQWEELEGSASEDESEIRSIAQSTMETESTTNERYDDLLDLDEDKRQMKLLRAEKDYQMFPDEIDTPLDTPARVRFEKYRGLRSFKNSPWNTKENLPFEYARIFQFENFKRTKKRILSSLDEEGAMTGWYVTVHIKGVPKAVGSRLNLMDNPLILYGLLPHENKMSVVNFLIKRTHHYSLPINSKEELIFQMGARRFYANPIFSQHTQGDKHKFERFLPSDVVTIATMYCPISYPPATVLVFKCVQGAHVLVATGLLHSIDPSRIVCKKILLSGHPLKINKRSAVVRYMFFTRDDVHWFKPVELKTKNGLKGHIKEPLGTHGHMKCIFDKQLKAHDTVLMPLYKRVFPKWTHNASVPHPLCWSFDEEVDMNCT